MKMLDKAETKTVYTYGNAGLYSGVKILNYTDRSPVSGAWQIPAGCTETIPPAAKDNYDIVWNGTEWGYEEQSKSDMSPAPTFTSVQSAKLSAVDSAASAAYSAGFASTANGTTLYYDSDENERLNYISAANLAASNVAQFNAEFPNGFPIHSRTALTAADSTKVTQHLTAAQIQQLGTDWRTRVMSVKSQVWALKSQINAATTIDALQAIAITIT